MHAPQTRMHAQTPSRGSHEVTDSGPPLHSATARRGTRRLSGMRGISGRTGSTRARDIDHTTTAILADGTAPGKPPLTRHPRRQKERVSPPQMESRNHRTPTTDGHIAKQNGSAHAGPPTFYQTRHKTAAPAEHAATRSHHQQRFILRGRHHTDRATKPPPSKTRLSTPRKHTCAPP